MIRTLHKQTPSGNNFYELAFRSAKEYGGGHISMSTQNDNIAGQQITARTIETDLAPANTQKQILRWLKNCAHHQCCPPQIDLPLPTRVIDVATLRLFTTNEAVGKYAALSYCWGRTHQTLLRRSTLRSFEHRIDLDGLPQTIKDAVYVTRSLSIPYLWVRPAAQLHGTRSNVYFDRWTLYA
jgi:hypothetical protein